jgi:hypothetical protein
MGDRAADPVMLGERARVEQEATVGQAGGDGVLDFGIDPFATVAHRSIRGALVGKSQAGFGEFEPDGGGPLVGEDVAAPIEIADQPVVPQPP